MEEGGESVVGDRGVRLRTRGVAPQTRAENGSAEEVVSAGAVLFEGEEGVERYRRRMFEL